MNRLLQYLLQFISQIWRRPLSLLRRGRYEREMEEEMHFHFEMQIEQNLDAGMAAEEAHYAARRQFGNQTWLKEVSREMWSLNSIETLIQDLRFGARMLAKNLGFTLIAVMTLALGIGANTAIFSVVNAVLLRPLPFQDAERLMMLGTVDTRKGDGLGSVSYPNFADWRAQSGSFERLAAFRDRNFTLTGSGEPVRLNGAVVSAGVFTVLRVLPNLGRSFRTEEDNAVAAVVILSL